MEQPRSERLITLFVAGLLAFNYPLLALFSVDGMLLGIPVLFVYLFSAWGAFILLLRLIVGTPQRQRDD